MLISKEDNDPDIRPKKIIAALSVFISTVGIWQVQTPTSDSSIASHTTDVLAETSEISTDSIEQLVLYNPRPIQTTSSVKTEITIETETIPFETEITYDAEKEVGTEIITQEGKFGLTERAYEIERFFGEELSRTLLSENTTAPIVQKVTRGTKPKQLETPQGMFTYRKTIDVWATSYDGNCKGCTGITYTGTTVDHGTCAVDPNIIPLGTTFYVPDYGICTAEDIGGAIYGNKIDVGFKNIHNGWWSARWVTIYLP